MAGDSRAARRRGDMPPLDCGAAGSYNSDGRLRSPTGPRGHVEPRRQRHGPPVYMIRGRRARRGATWINNAMLLTCVENAESAGQPCLMRDDQRDTSSGNSSDFKRASSVGGGLCGHGCMLVHFNERRP